MMRISDDDGNFNAADKKADALWIQVVYVTDKHAIGTAAAGFNNIAQPCLMHWYERHVYVLKIDSE